MGLLIVPATPLLSTSVALGAGFALQAETNFQKIHGGSLQWFHGPRALEGGYLLLACAAVRDDSLNPDRYVAIPYLGYGWQWVRGLLLLEGRAGIGMTLQSSPRLAPVVKLSVGMAFR